jgi:hypothetical protein
VGEYLAGNKGSVLPTFITLFFTLVGTFISFTAIILTVSAA